MILLLPVLLVLSGYRPYARHMCMSATPNHHGRPRGSFSPQCYFPTSVPLCLVCLPPRMSFLRCPPREFLYLLKGLSNLAASVPLALNHSRWARKELITMPWLLSTRLPPRGDGKPLGKTLSILCGPSAAGTVSCACWVLSKHLPDEEVKSLSYFNIA